MKAVSKWSALPTVAPELIFELDRMAKAATEPKANLTVGAYRDEGGMPYPLSVVRKAEERIAREKKYDKEYLPISGYQNFIDAAARLLYGFKGDELNDAPNKLTKERVFGVQTLSGTGAVRTGADFFARSVPRDTTEVLLSNPTWGNHHSIFEDAGFKKIKTYRYWNPAKKGLDIDGMLEDVRNAQDGSIVVLHQCAHNPTGVDPSKEQWKEIANTLKAKRHQVFFDSAYQGYATGNLDDDAYAARLFASMGFEFVVAQSFSKNLGLYCERVGTLTFVFNVDHTGNGKTEEDIKQQSEQTKALLRGVVERCIRGNYSSPPAHGARVAHLVLTDPELRKEWEAELKHMADRIKHVRQLVYDELVALKTPGDWSHIVNQIGMFSFLGLNKEQCMKLQQDHVFVMPTGRASMAGLTVETTKLLAKSIDEAVRTIPSSK